MSTQTKQPPPRVDSPIDGISSLSDSLSLSQNFMTALKSFTSDTRVQAVSQAIDRIPELEKNIQEREKRVKQLNAELDNKNRNHSIELQNSLKVYRVAYDEFKEETRTLQRKIDEMQEVLRKRERTISELKSKEEELKSNGRKVEDMYKTKVAKLKEKEQELKGTKERAEKGEKKADDLSIKWTESRNRVVVLEQSLEASRNQNATLTETLNSTTGRLNQLESFAVPLYDVDLENLAAELEKLWKSATLLVGAFLKRDLPDEKLQKDWITLRNTDIVKYNIPLPQSNSAIAKEMRIAKVLAIFAKLVDKYIFQPTYLLIEKSRFRELLRRLASFDPEKERFARGMMLSVFPHEQDEGDKSMVDWVIVHLMETAGVDDILAAEDIPRFEDELEVLLVRAQEVWRSVLRSTQSLGPGFGFADAPNFQWQTFEFQVANITEGAEAIPPVTATSAEEEPFVIFPRIYLLKGEPEPITAGTVLLETQLRAARQEFRESNFKTPFTEPTLSPHNSKPNRRASNVEAARNGVAGKPFLS
ncbi:hypothetical protein K469DRAFT_2802 [Zopfia rhizophila CBS 207.26]|uniref:Mei5 protein n=1 Tax=Zopfia rhizophila CBS 207.26 TaxID=1314779 RepID=A0A6A6EU03_9PEZI|nr:hypothetical protein K469DRAFT_2802 [Zopfia rhizophila CBS 207.26]